MISHADMVILKGFTVVIYEQWYMYMILSLKAKSFINHFTRVLYRKLARAKGLQLFGTAGSLSG